MEYRVTEKYRVTDPQWVYDEVIIEIDFPVDLLNPADKITVLMYAIEEMYGCPISDVTPRSVRDMVGKLLISKVTDN